MRSMSRMSFSLPVAAVFLSAFLILSSCSSRSSSVVRYGWFETEGILLIEIPEARAFLSVSLPLAILQAWFDSGEAGSDPSAFAVMRSFCGLPADGTFSGTADNLAEIRRLADTLASQDAVLAQSPGPASRIQALEKYAGDLRKTNLPATLNGLSSIDAASLLHRAQGGGRSMAYDAAQVLDTSLDIKEVQAWFVSWLQGAIAEISSRSITE